MSTPNRLTPSKSSKSIEAEHMQPQKQSAAAAFGAKLFRKCKSATFQIDGATYTIGE